MLRLVTLALTLALSLLTTAGLADTFDERPLAIEGQVGVTGPYGPLALAVDVGASRFFSVNAGAGHGTYGLVGGIAPRLRVPVTDTVGFGVQGGLSLSA